MPVFVGFLVVVAVLYQLFFRYEKVTDAANPNLVYKHDNLTGKNDPVDGDAGNLADIEAHKAASDRYLKDPNARPEDFDNVMPNSDGIPNGDASNSASWKNQSSDTTQNSGGYSNNNTTDNSAYPAASSQAPLNGYISRSQQAVEPTYPRRRRHYQAESMAPMTGYAPEPEQEERPVRRHRRDRDIAQEIEPTSPPVPGREYHHREAAMQPLIGEHSEDAAPISRRRRHTEDQVDENAAPPVPGVVHRVAMARVLTLPTTQAQYSGEPIRQELRKVRVIDRPASMRSWDWRDVTRAARMGNPVPVPDTVVQDSYRPPTPTTRHVDRVADVRPRPYGTRKVDLDQDGSTEDIIQSAEGHDGLIDISIVKNGKEIFYGRGRQLTVLPSQSMYGWKDIALKAHGKIIGIYRYNPSENAYSALDKS
jgi:hypothetical protein